MSATVPAKIPATIVTGFLGAGKTSLIRNLMTNANGRKIALVINEFGDLGIDRQILAGCGIEGCTEDDIIELANGCICCTVADDFLPTIERLLAREMPPEHIVIETSGLALPKPLVKAFGWPEVKSRVTVDGVVAVIDAVAVSEGRFADDPEAVQAQREADAMLDHDNPLEEVFEDQLQCADLVVLNKSDLLTDDGLALVASQLRGALRAEVKLISVCHGAVDTAAVFGLMACAEDDLDARPSHHDGLDGEHDHDDFESFTMALDPVTDPAHLLDRLRRTIASHDILRIKGFVDIPDKALRLVLQGVGPRLQTYFDRPWGAEEARAGELVVIGLTGLDRVAIEAAIRA